MEMKDHTTKLVTIDDYDELFKLWNSTEQSRRAMNPVDDSREGIERYLKRNPNTCSGKRRWIMMRHYGL